MQDYKSSFHVSSEAGSLDKSQLRFAWLTRTLAAREVDSKEVFPDDWRIMETLAVSFCKQTRFLGAILIHLRFSCLNPYLLSFPFSSQDISILLTKAEKTDNMDVKLVLATLQKTLDFEGKLAQKFSITRTEEDRGGDDDDVEDDEKPSDNADAIKQKYKRYIAEKKKVYFSSLFYFIYFLSFLFRSVSNRIPYHFPE